MSQTIKNLLLVAANRRRFERRTKTCYAKKQHVGLKRFHMNVELLGLAVHVALEVGEPAEPIANKLITPSVLPEDLL